MIRGCDSRRDRGAALEDLACVLGRCAAVVVLVLASENGVTPARRAISCSPSCQCIASAALQGMDISSATGAHIWCLNLCHRFSEGSDRRPAIIDIPFVQPRELILTVLVPLTPSLQVILIMQTTADGTPSRQLLADILPLHGLTAESDDLFVFFGRPFRLFLCRRLRRMGSLTSLAGHGGVGRDRC